MQSKRWGKLQKINRKTRRGGRLSVGAKLGIEATVGRISKISQRENASVIPVAATVFHARLHDFLAEFQKRTATRVL